MPTRPANLLVRGAIAFGAVVLASLPLTGCAGTPDTADLMRATPGADGLLVIAHGYHNNPSHWPRTLVGRIRELVPNAERWDIYAHDWEREANRILTASRTGYRIGRSLAAEVVGQGDPYPLVHLVGQSLGAHLVQGFVDAYRELGGGAVVHVTFLDPFLIRGVVGFGWGVRNFGRGADLAENYIVGGEPAVGTNRYLLRAHNFDISALVPDEMRSEFVGPHWWVVRYYRATVGAGGPGFSISPMAGGGRGYDPRKLAGQYVPGEVTHATDPGTR